MVDGRISNRNIIRILGGGLIPILGILLVTGCDSTEPDTEDLASFSLQAPSTVQMGITFNLAVTAVGSQGTRPYTPYSGYVHLTSSDCTIRPDSVQVLNGVGTVAIVLSGATGDHTITATSGKTVGSITLTSAMLTALPGDTDDPAADAIPQFEFLPAEDEYSEDHPDFGGFPVSFTNIILVFAPGTTVGQANTVIGDLGGMIVGG